MVTALDPSPVLASRREALNHLDALREAVAGFLDRPTAAGLGEVTSSTQAFVQFEADEVLPEAAASELTLDQVQALAAGHELLGSRLNLLAWAVPGSAEAQTQVHQLRHDLLSHIDRYQALRLPRGRLISPAD